MIPALEFSRDDIPVVLPVKITLCCGLQQLPGIGMHGNNLFPEFVNFIVAVQLLQAIDGIIQVIAHFAHVVGWIERERFILVPCFRRVAFLH